jgi:4-hydroxybenzoate polyprenyltransferase
MTSLLGRAVTFGRMIRFTHSVFALPFALAAAALAARDGSLTLPKVGWIVLAMVGARSAAMGFNRLADHALDARNPRTLGRELPRGALSRGEVWIFVLLASFTFVLAAAALNPLCLALSPLALLIVFGYSYTKRFTPLSHLALGLSLGIAPVGAWLAVRGSFSPVSVLLAVGVLFWVAGFDTIYASQDLEVDRRERLHSLPASFGIRKALAIARIFHVLALVALAGVFVLVPLHPVYLVGLGLVAALLVYEHSLVSAGDLSRVNAAFFTVNGWISVLYFVTTLAAVLLV